jgi:flagellar biosynthesis protein FliQ
MHDLAMTFFVSVITIGLVVGIYVAVLSAMQGPLK